MTMTQIFTIEELADLFRTHNYGNKDSEYYTRCDPTYRGADDLPMLHLRFNVGEVINFDVILFALSYSTQMQGSLTFNTRSLHGADVHYLGHGMGRFTTRDPLVYIHDRVKMTSELELDKTLGYGQNLKYVMKGTMRIMDFIHDNHFVLEYKGRRYAWNGFVPDIAVENHVTKVLRELQEFQPDLRLLWNTTEEAILHYGKVRHPSLVMTRDHCYIRFLNQVRRDEDDSEIIDLYDARMITREFSKASRCLEYYQNYHT